MIKVSETRSYLRRTALTKAAGFPAASSLLRSLLGIAARRHKLSPNVLLPKAERNILRLADTVGIPTGSEENLYRLQFRTADAIRANQYRQHQLGLAGDFPDLWPDGKGGLIQGAKSRMAERHGRMLELFRDILHRETFRSSNPYRVTK